MEQEAPECEYDNARTRLEELILSSGDDTLCDALEELIDEERQERQAEMEARHKQERDQWHRNHDESHGWRYSDPTGQDADDPEVEASFREKIEMEDRHLRESDPDSYAERKHFEACSRYLP